ncbi:MAG TPA: DUF3018 domain-containing protein [Gammaproteobacteria bacterium]|jgi:spore cortex formation protein SpoVR/YcgB (stage V sporulation)|nr:DUF3018 domain-containing protein [Gammaproteobacteria bacterium]
MQKTISDQSRFQRFRSRRKALGMKELRLWVPDPSVPGFNKEAHRQSKLASELSEEQEALKFIEDAAENIEGWE